MISIQNKLLILGVEGLHFEVPGLVGTKPRHRNIDFKYAPYHYYQHNFSPRLLKFARNLLRTYQKNMFKVFDIYEERCEKLNIMLIDEGRYHSGHSREENCLKIHPSWEFDGYLERHGNIWSNICNFLSH